MLKARMPLQSTVYSLHRMFLGQVDAVAWPVPDRN